MFCVGTFEVKHFASKLTFVLIKVLLKKINRAESNEVF